MYSPKYSIVIPLYNKEKFIKNSVSSALNQTYHDIEVIVVDDGSIDSSVELLNAIKDERLKLVSKLNGGVSSARNLGIKSANGQYIAFLDADDEYELTFIEKIENTRLKFENSDAFATAYFTVINGVRKPSFAPKENKCQPYELKTFFDKWAYGSFFCASSIVVKRDYFYRYDKWFPTGESLGEDQEMWFSIYENSQIVYLPTHLSNYNMIDANSLTQQLIITEELPFITRLKSSNRKNEFNEKGIFISKYELERAFNNARVGNKKVALKLFMKNFKTFRFLKLKVIVILAVMLPRKNVV